MSKTPSATRTKKTPKGVAASVRPKYQPPGYPHRYLALLGIEPLDTTRLLRQIEEGFTFRALEHLQHNLAMPMERVAELVQIKPRTLSRRREQGRLLPDESDHLVRLSRVFGRALELFDDDAEAARRWLSIPQAALGGAVPLAVAKTDTGSREVEDLIGRLEHGVFS